MGDVKITNVEGIYLRAPTIRDRSDSSQDSLIVRVTTDAGVVGYGEVDSCPVAAKAIIEAPTSHRRVRGLRRILLGKEVLDTTELWNLMYKRRDALLRGREGATIHAMAGVDIALWDIKGKASDSPSTPCLAVPTEVRSGLCQPLVRLRSSKRVPYGHKRR